MLGRSAASDAEGTQCILVIGFERPVACGGLVVNDIALALLVREKDGLQHAVAMFWAVEFEFHLG